MTLEEMTAQRDALLAARFRGVRTVEIEGRRVTYALGRRNGGRHHGSSAPDRPRPQRAVGSRRILTSASKGL